MWTKNWSLLDLSFLHEMNLISLRSRFQKLNQKNENVFDRGGRNNGVGPPGVNFTRVYSTSFNKYRSSKINFSGPPSTRPGLFTKANFIERWTYHLWRFFLHEIEVITLVNTEKQPNRLVRESIDNNESSTRNKRPKLQIKSFDEWQWMYLQLI